MSTEQISEFVVNTDFDAIPLQAVREAKRCILDTIGNILSGSVHGTGKIIAEYVQETGGKPESSVIGFGFKTSAAYAALANGTFSHIDELGDHGLHWASYPSGPILPAVLALAERASISGKRTLEAYIMGWEGGAAIAAVTSAKMAARGIDATVGTGCLAAVLGASKLLQLTGTQTRAAMGIAASESFGMLANWGWDAKPYYCGRAASTGVTAGLLAQKGFTANESILEGDIGYCRVLSAESWDSETATKSLGDVWRMASESAIKPYPCCGITHRSIDGIIFLSREHKFGPEDVAVVECLVPPIADWLVHKQPQTGLQANHSLHYCVARALMDGEVVLSQFEEDAVRDPKVQALCGKIRAVTDRNRKYTMHEAHAVRVKLKDGREYYREVPYPKGFPLDPLTAEEVTSKFLSCASRALSTRDAERCIEMVSQLESLDRITELMQLVGQGRS